MAAREEFGFDETGPHISQVRQTRNVDVGMNVDVQSHPAGHSTDKNYVSFHEGTNRKQFQHHLLIFAQKHCE